MNLTELFIMIKALGMVILIMFIFLLLTLGLLALVDLLFETKLLKRVENWIFYYEDEEVEDSI